MYPPASPDPHPEPGTPQGGYTYDPADPYRSAGDPPGAAGDLPGDVDPPGYPAPIVAPFPAPGTPVAAPAGSGNGGSGRQGPRRMSEGRRRIVALLAALAFLAVPAIAGYEVGRDHGSSATSESATAVVPDGSSQAPSDGGTTFDPSGPSTGSGGSTAASDLGALAARVDDSVVNINTSVEGGGLAAGTGIIISKDGLVLTNNHVISGATSLTVELTSTGVTRPARVLGYSVISDIAVIQVQNVGNLSAAEIGSSSSLDVGETILALGNAGGTGGTPSAVSGTVTGLDQQITASDADGTNAQTLEGLIQLAADIRSGDSGGPVVDTDGRVVGVTVAASVSNSFGFPGGGGGEGYAIPIEDAVAIAKKIVSGEGGEGIRVGATRAVLGVSIQPTLTTQRTPGGVGSGSGSGASVVGVQPGSGAEDAGLRAGDTIVALDGRRIGTTNDLTRALVAYDPGETISITWVDANGRTRTADLVLGEGPPA